MDEFELKIFQSEIKRQCDFARISVQNINEALIDKNNANVWYHVQGFLISAANVSKLLWGSRESEILRQPLRDSLGISENMFKEIRSLRNDFEHFDERIEKWARTSKNRNFIDSNIGLSDILPIFDKGDCLRNFDTSKIAITFKGKEYLIQPVVDELYTIHEKISQLQSVPSWES